MVGEISISLPPGFNIREPSQKQLQTKKSSFGSKNKQPMDNSMIQSNFADPTTIVFMSGNTLPQQPQISQLFNDPSNPQSLFDSQLLSTNSHQQNQPAIHLASQAFSLQSPDLISPQQQNNQIPQVQSQQLQLHGTQQELTETGHRFRSVVNQRTHKEISELLQLANPNAYQEHRNNKFAAQRSTMRAKKLQQVQNVVSADRRAFQERRDTISQALAHNMWHAPVKKAQILQKLLESVDDPLEGDVDMAVVAHGNRKFGDENPIECVQKLQTQSLNQTNQKSVSQKRSDASQSSVKGERFPKTNIDDVEEIVTQDQLSKSVHSLKEIARQKTQPEGDNAVNKTGTGAGQDDRCDQVSGQTIEQNSSRNSSRNQNDRDVLSPKGPLMETTPTKRQRLPPIRQSTYQGSGSKKDNRMSQGDSSVAFQRRIKPDLLAKRKERRMTTNKRHNYSRKGSMYRTSSKISAGNSMPTKNGGYGLGRSNSMDSADEAAANIDAILEMLARLKEEPDKQSEKPDKQSEKPEVTQKKSWFVKKSQFPEDMEKHTFNQNDEPSNILSLQVSDQFQPKRAKNTVKKLQSPIQSPESFQNRWQAQTTKNKPKRRLSLSNLTSEDIEAFYKPEFILPDLNDKQQMPRGYNQVSKSKQLQDQRERDQIKAAVDHNNDSIRELLIEMAQLLQRPDSEARYLRQNVLQPHNLGKYNLRQYVPKTIQLNVGQLYQPLTFTFDDFGNGNFTVYFSHKIKQPDEENGYDQKEIRANRVIFPIGQQNAQPNMMRYSKDKVLYITMESDVDCSPSIRVNHNKKDEPEVAVASVAQSQNNRGAKIRQQQPDFRELEAEDSDESEEDGDSPKRLKQIIKPSMLTDRELEIQAKRTLETLAFMLGSEEKTQHADKLNQMFKKKIKYMIKEDLGVAKDFLNLVDVLKQHKIRMKKIMRDNRNKNSLLQDRNLQLILQADQDEASGNLMGSHLAKNATVNDLFKLQKLGYLSKQQYNELRQDQQKQKKKEIDAVNHMRSLDGINKKEYRRQLQEIIINNFRKQVADQRFVATWVQNILTFKLFSRLQKAKNKKIQHSAFLARVFWIVMKMKMKLSIRLKRTGKTSIERQRRNIRCALSSIGSSVHLRDITASKTILEALKWHHTLNTIRNHVRDTAKQVRNIQERFRAYWQVRVAQINLLVSIIKRECERLFIASIKEQDPELKKVGSKANKLKQENIKKVATAYYQACQFNYEPIFFAWRKKCKEFQEQGLEDMTGGWHYPFLMPRGIKTMAEVRYTVSYKKLSLKKYMERASYNCRQRFQYFLNTNKSKNQSSSKDKDDSSLQRKSTTTMNARKHNNMRRKNPNFATLEDAISKQEEKFNAEIIKDLKNAAYYPTRPAMKFIPTAKMTHQLIHQAIMLQNKSFEAPQSYREQFDPRVSEQDSGIGPQQSTTTGKDNSSQPFKVIEEKGRLISKLPEKGKDSIDSALITDDPLYNQSIESVESEKKIKLGGLVVDQNEVISAAFRLPSANSSQHDLLQKEGNIMVHKEIDEHLLADDDSDDVLKDTNKTRSVITDQEAADDAQSIKISIQPLSSGKHQSATQLGSMEGNNI